jgi:hypothetical protein
MVGVMRRISAAGHVVAVEHHEVGPLVVRVASKARQVARNFF